LGGAGDIGPAITIHVGEADGVTMPPAVKFTDAGSVTFPDVLVFRKNHDA